MKQQSQNFILKTTGPSYHQATKRKLLESSTQCQQLAVTIQTLHLFPIFP